MRDGVTYEQPGLSLDLVAGFAGDLMLTLREEFARGAGTRNASVRIADGADAGHTLFREAQGR